ncbi:DEAD/DEAH box helicase [Pantoea anthophila]|uniref:DEAD/DEAH box helicase n=1 Tax=Pantoea anthophila TaxID=470931 RepID=UPI0027815A5A|nr:DEAD/DEAH box helicase [Pantoea anthophila]MDQ1213863.1 superfamily II DNA/RNA helicase [Pantoea anthophila]
MEISTAATAIKHPDFTQVFNFLIEYLFLKNRNDSRKVKLSDENIRRATWLASLGSSGDENDRDIASAFGTLLYLYDPENELYVKACYVLQSRAGNIVSAKHLKGLIEENKILKHFSVSLDFELTSQKFMLEKKLPGEDSIFFTHFQKELWSKLERGQNVAVSAPTSAGKSFVIKKFIYERVINANFGYFVYVVPSKALINQVGNEMARELKDIATIMTTYKEMEDGCSKVVFVLTPERCMKLLHEKGDEAPSVVFFDEIQNLEDSSRGNVFENVIYRMTSTWKTTQFIMAGPYINNLHGSLDKIVDIDLVEQKTSATPVFQLKIILTIHKNKKNVSYKLVSPVGGVIAGDYNIGRSLYSKLSSSKGAALKYITSLLNEDEQNIIYAPKKNLAEGWALAISSTDEESVSIEGSVSNKNYDARIENLCSFLESEIHPLYSLVRSLKEGVAFHHGGLLDVARLEVEDLFADGVIRNLVCTSTLLQGVNLPADRMIVLSPRIGDYELNHFDFLNLIGRAGRINTSLYGEVFCIQLVDEQWAEDKIDSKEIKEIESAVLKKLNDHGDSVVSYIDMVGKDVLSNQGDYKAINLASYLRSQFLVDLKHFEKIISNSNLTANQIRVMNNRLEVLSESLSVPKDIIKKNPFVDPILIDELFYMVSRDGLAQWCINKYPGRKSGEVSDAFDFQRMSYYNQYKSVITRLNDIFEIEKEINFKEDGETRKSQHYVGINRLIYDSHKWMLGKKYRFFIDSMVNNKFQKKGIAIDYKKIDGVTNFITTHINTNLTFILVKYLSLWADVIGSFMTEEERTEKSFFLNISSMLEMGSYDPLVLEIMAYGINRSTAIELLKKQKKNDAMSVGQYLAKYDLDKLLPLHRKYLSRAGFGK